MKIKPITFISLTILIGCFGIFSSMGLGYWQSESDKTPAKFIGTELDGEFRADDIRGSYTFGEINKLYGVPLETLATAFEIDIANASLFKCKDLETVFGDSEVEIGTGSVKMFVAFYLGQPYDLNDNTTYLTQSGAEMIKAEGNPTDEQLNYLQTHIANISADVITTEGGKTNTEVPPIAEKSTSTETKTDTSSVDYATLEVKGSDYFKDLAKTHDIPLDDLASAFLVSQAKAPYYQVKDLKNDFNKDVAEIGTSSVKMFIAFYNGLNFDLSSTNAFQTNEGSEIIQTKGNPTAEQIAYLETHLLGE